MDVLEMFAAVGTAMSVVSLILCVIIIASNWVLFTKAGKPGWAAIVPIYNIWVQFEIVWGKGVMMFLMLVPLVNFVIAIMTNIKLAKAFGKGTGFGILLIFLAPIAMPMLAFGNTSYVGPQ